MGRQRINKQRKKPEELLSCDKDEALEGTLGGEVRLLGL